MLCFFSSLKFLFHRSVLFIVCSLIKTLFVPIETKRCKSDKNGKTIGISTDAISEVP